MTCIPVVIPKCGWAAAEGVILAHREVYPTAGCLLVRLVPATWALLCAPLLMGNVAPSRSPGCWAPLVLLLSQAGWKLHHVCLQRVAIMLLTGVWKQTKRNKTKSNYISTHFVKPLLIMPLSMTVLEERAAWSPGKQLCGMLNCFSSPWKIKLNLSSYMPTFKKVFFWPGLRKSQNTAIFSDTRGCVWCYSWVWKFNSFTPTPKLTEQPSFTLTCHPNKLQGRDTSLLNQLVAASE